MPPILSNGEFGLINKTFILNRTTSDTEDQGVQRPVYSLYGQLDITIGFPGIKV